MHFFKVRATDVHPTAHLEFKQLHCEMHQIYIWPIKNNFLESNLYLSHSDKTQTFNVCVVKPNNLLWCSIILITITYLNCLSLLTLSTETLGHFIIDNGLMIKRQPLHQSNVFYHFDQLITKSHFNLIINFFAKRSSQLFSISRLSLLCISNKQLYPGFDFNGGPLAPGQ